MRCATASAGVRGDLLAHTINYFRRITRAYHAVCGSLNTEDRKAHTMTSAGEAGDHASRGCRPLHGA